jgi:hypothetical protein
VVVASTERAQRMQRKTSTEAMGRAMASILWRAMGEGEDRSESEKEAEEELDEELEKCVLGGRVVVDMVAMVVVVVVVVGGA